MEQSGPKHRHNSSLKSSLPRRATIGPLDAPEDLPNIATDVISRSKGEAEALPLNRNLAYLLRPEIYHPLTQLEIPPAFRSELPAISSGEPLDSSLKLLESLLKEGHFLPAAHVSAAILTSSSVSQTDYTVIFYLLYIRLACLELTGNTILAAQEAKALEDLSSSFYYFDDGTEPMESTQETAKESTIARHIVPWHLRVLAVRLQSIGFGDARRGIAGLYELGLEARKHISRRDISNQERTMWKDRLSDLGIRVVNALVEMGDLDAARRSLASTETPAAHTKSWITRMVLLNLRVGDVEAARRALGSISDAEPDILTPLLSMAEGKYSDAAAEWSRVRENHSGSDDEAMIMQNLAVCLLYAGKLNEAREILEALVEGENSFQALTFNLATIYELCSENANTLKLGLTERISAHPPSPFRNWERPSTDFKV